MPSLRARIGAQVEVEQRAKRHPLEPLERPSQPTLSLATWPEELVSCLPSRSLSGRLAAGASYSWTDRSLGRAQETIGVPGEIKRILHCRMTRAIWKLERVVEEYMVRAWV